MLPRVLLAARTVDKVPVRGKALQNWARPSIDELLVPSQPWTRVYNRNQKKFTAHLLVGLTTFSFTVLVLKARIEPNWGTTPWHLLK